MLVESLINEGLEERLVDRLEEKLGNWGSMISWWNLFFGMAIELSCS
jgi:hypothetical protein